jgi:hypothetical protein
MSDSHMSSPRQSLASHTHASSVSNSIPGFSRVQTQPYVVNAAAAAPAPAFPIAPNRARNNSTGKGTTEYIYGDTPAGPPSPDRGASDQDSTLFVSLQQLDHSSESPDIRTDPIILVTLRDHFTRQEERDRQLAHDFTTALEKNSHEVRSALQENSREVRSALDDVRVTLTEIKDTFITYLDRQEKREKEAEKRHQEAEKRHQEAEKRHQETEKRQEQTQQAILEVLQRSATFVFHSKQTAEYISID